MSLKFLLISAMALMTSCFAASLSAQTVDARVACAITQLEDGDGERLILNDQARIQLDGTQIKEFEWESSVFRRDHGHECSIDTSDGLEAEVLEKGWRIKLKDAAAARANRGYDFDRGYQCTIRLERDGDELHIKPNCPMLCGSRKNFSALSVNVKTGLCTYDQ